MTLRGELVAISLPGDYGKPRPALVIQNDLLAELDSVVLCPVSSDLRTADFRVTVEPTANNGMRHVVGDWRDLNRPPYHPRMNQTTSTLAQFDEAGARRIEAVYLTPDVVAQRQQVLQRIAPQPNERVLDIGCGPGLTSQALGEAVGATGRVLAVDIAEPMLDLARHRCAAMPQVQFQNLNVTNLPMADGSFDMALATQVYEYVPDIAQALKELARVLRPGGRALLVDTDWESAVWASRNDARMRQVLDTWNQHIPWPQLPRSLMQALQQAGFKDVQVEVMPLLNTRFDGHTYSAGMLDVIGAFVTGRDGLTPEAVAAWQADVRSMDQHTGYFFSLNRFVFVAHKP